MTTVYDGVWADDPVATGLAAASGCPVQPLPPSGEALLASRQSETHLVVLSLPATAYGEPAPWRDALATLERTWFSVLLAGLKDGTLDSLTLHGLGPERGHACKRGLMVAAGIAAFLGFLVAMVPASQLARRLPANIVLERPSGTIWSGQARSLAFQGRPLGEVIDEFNRYSRVPVEIDDATLRALRVSGSFDAYDIETFLGFLESLDGVALQRTATSVRVIRISPPEGAAPPPAR